MRAYLRQHLAMLAYFALIGAVLLGAYRLETVARSTNDALCSFKEEFEVRAANTAHFIEEIKLGLREPIQGISIADLERSLANTQATIDSLESLECG